MKQAANPSGDLSHPYVDQELRRIARTVRTPEPTPGFAGPGHTAAEVVGSRALTETNPFVLLMDDRLDFEAGQSVGEPHPHAGLETVTLVIEGSLDTGTEGLLETGDAAWMNAGGGLVHNENVIATGRARVLQLWIALPKAERHSEPDLQIVRRAELPVRREPGVEARLYSGTTGTLRSTTRNRAPITMIDFVLAPETPIIQDLPGSYSGFLYVLEGSVAVAGVHLGAAEVGWLARGTNTTTQLQLKSGAAGARVLFFAGEPQDGRFVHHGPFVAGSEAEIAAYLSPPM